MVGSLDLCWVSFGKQPRFYETCVFGRAYLACPLVLDENLGLVRVALAPYPLPHPNRFLNLSALSQRSKHLEK